MLAGHDPTPKFHAASMMFCAHLPPSKAARGESRITQTAAPDVATCCANRPNPDSAFKRARSRTTMKCQGWLLRLLPLIRPALRIFRRMSSGIAFSANVRMSRLERIAL